MKANELSEQVCALGRELLQSGLVWGNAGNISVRSGPDRMMITASGTRLGALSGEDLVETSISVPVGENLPRRPSKECPMHRAAYSERPGINAIIHASPFYSTLAACSDLEIPARGFVEAMYYIERVARAPYAHPGSQALADAIRQAARSANVILMENHGVLVMDASLREALMGLQTLEMAARMAVEARSAGIVLKPVSEAVAQDFLERSGYRPRREWPR